MERVQSKGNGSGQLRERACFICDATNQPAQHRDSLSFPFFVILLLVVFRRGAPPQEGFPESQRALVLPVLVFEPARVYDYKQTKQGIARIPATADDMREKRPRLTGGPAPRDWTHKYLIHFDREKRE